MKVNVKHMTATSECGCCGESYAYGYVITVNGKVVIKRIPRANCFGRDNYAKDDLIADIVYLYRAEFNLDQSEYNRTDVIEFMLGALLSGTMTITVEH